MLNRLIDFALRHRAVRVALDRVGFRSIANWILARWAPVHMTAGFPVRYRTRTLNSVLIAKEIFTDRSYAGMLPLEGIRSFADLGCNTGFFSCWLASALRCKELTALLIDANPKMAREAEWHIRTNQLRNMKVACGIVGAAGEGHRADFFLHPDAALSSRFPAATPQYVTAHQWQRIEAPILSLAAEWRKHFGDARCDLIKVDIEGSEMSLLQSDADFVFKARYLAIEVHPWAVDVGAFEDALRNFGFGFVRSLSETPDATLRFYAKRKNPRQ